MQATLTYIGRVLSLTPAILGRHFEQSCYVERTKMEPPTLANGWQARRIVTPLPNYWYAEHHETKELKFYALSGYGPRIEYNLKQMGIETEVIDDLPCGLPEPDFDAVAGAEWRGSQPQVVAAICASRCGVVKCPTGWGKSLVASRLAKIYPKSKIVLTVASVDVAKDIHAGMLKWDAKTGFVGGGKHDVQRVTVAVTHSLKYCDREFTNLLLGDECHTLAAESFVESLGEFRRAKFIGFSASPTGRSDGADGIVEALFGPLIADVPYSEAVESGNVVPIEVWMIPSPDGPNVQSIENKTAKDKKAIWTNDARNRRIAAALGLAWAEYGHDAQTLVMVDKTEHAFRLQQLLPDFTVVTGSTDSDSVLKWQASGAMLPGQVICTPKDRERHRQAFEAGTLKRAISTFVWSKGVNFQDLKILVRADGLATPIQATQVPGRLSRLGTDKDKGGGLLIDLYDSFSPDLERRSKGRITEYRRHGWTIKRL